MSNCGLLAQRTGVRLQQTDAARILLIAQPIVLSPNTAAVSVVLGFKNGCRGLILVIPFKKNVCDYSLKL